MHTSWCARPGGLTVTLQGTEGTVHLRDGSLRWNPSTVHDLDGPPPDAGAALAEFLHSLQAGEPPDQLGEARRAGKAIHALLSGAWPAAS
ncbi:MAG TPA: hypothetical protein VGM60_06060 [Pseudonocardia sp.]|jgi:hypothetical protein|uniref:hypothetical protein n=1 Tax=Pseudonocardia sp. TaxID=60912 RepID=UPI002F422296